MSSINNSILTKGIFAVGVVAIAGVVGAVNFAQAATNDNTSGYGTGSQQAQTAADKFQAALTSDTNNFTSQVKALEATAQSQLQSGTPVANFDSQFNAATTTYTNTTNDAFNNFRTQVAGFANTAQSKDQFIDQFNHAKADYLNQLDAAKNQLAASLSNLGDNANQVKDQFIGSFNADRDAYSNMLEQAKNDFAATVSNL